MKSTPLSPDGLLLLEPEVFDDPRGFFFESYSQAEFTDFGIEADFLQDNHSGSKRGVLRGLHYQINQEQGKLVRVVVGEVFDVAVDLRRSSGTFGKSASVQLSAENRRMLWIPPGFAHGFYTLSEWAEVVYKATNYYSPDDERTLLWSDPALAIAWPLVDGEPPLLSKKDSLGKPLSEVESFP